MAHTFEDLLTEHLPRLRASAILMTRNRADADDVLQETAVKALRAQAQFTPGTNFGAWVYRIMRNEFISSCRRARRSAVRIDDVHEEALARHSPQESSFFCGEVMGAIGSLRNAEREILTLVCVGGLSYEEAAETLLCSVGTVKSRLWRARTSLEKTLTDGKQRPRRAIAVRPQFGRDLPRPIERRPD